MDKHEHNHNHEHEHEHDTVRRSRAAFGPVCWPDC